jgi:cell division protein FtsB
MTPEEVKKNAQLGKKLLREVARALPDHEKIRAWLEGGAPPDYMGSWSGGTPLTSAIKAGNIACVRLLLEGKADPNQGGGRPMSDALNRWATIPDSTKSAEILELLVGHGAVVGPGDLARAFGMGDRGPLMYMLGLPPERLDQMQISRVTESTGKNYALTLAEGTQAQAIIEATKAAIERHRQYTLEKGRKAYASAAEDKVAALAQELGQMKEEMTALRAEINALKNPAGNDIGKPKLTAPKAP